MEPSGWPLNFRVRFEGEPERVFQTSSNQITNFRVLPPLGRYNILRNPIRPRLGGMGTVVAPRDRVRDETVEVPEKAKTQTSYRDPGA